MRAVFVTVRRAEDCAPYIACAADSLSQLHFHSIIRDADVDISLRGHNIELGCDFTFVAGHNFRSAMCDNGVRHAFFLAPCQLRPNRRVTDQRSAAFANKGARDRGAIDCARVLLVRRVMQLARRRECVPFLREFGFLRLLMD